MQCQARSIIIGLLLVLSLLAFGPAHGAWATPPATPATPEDAASLSAADILSRASQRLAETQTVRFELKVEGDTFIDAGKSLRLIEAKGELARPDRVRTEFKVVALERATITIQLIIVGNQWWTTDLISGEWTTAPAEFEYDPSVLFDNQDGIGPIMNRVTGAERLADEKVRDRKAFHIHALVDQAIVGPLTSNILDGTPITVDLWIDQSTYDLLRARLAEPKVDAGTETPAIWTLDLFDHGADFVIEPPA
jgi:hypothetical protein